MMDDNFLLHDKIGYLSEKGENLADNLRLEVIMTCA